MDKELAGFGWYIKRIDNALAREACRNVQSHNLTCLLYTSDAADE